ncbi:hypothetical protein ABPG74_013281 [Tetrahymena malaccensis]
MSSCNSSSISGNLNHSHSGGPLLTAQQSQAARDLLQVEQEIKNTVSLLKKLKINKNDSWIQEHINVANSQQPSSNLYPKFNKGTNYYQEFWRTYLMNEMMIAKIKEFSSENKLLDNKIQELEQLHREYQKLVSMKNKKKNRRTANEIEKSHICPYVECQKLYGSEVSLNLHIKLKHNGGNKTERERLARSICLAQENGDLAPDLCLNFPPGYLDQFKAQYNKEKERQLKLEQQGENLESNTIEREKDLDAVTNQDNSIKDDQEDIQYSEEEEEQEESIRQENKKANKKKDKETKQKKSKCTNNKNSKKQNKKLRTEDYEEDQNSLSSTPVKNSQSIS